MVRDSRAQLLLQIARLIKTVGLCNGQREPRTLMFCKKQNTIVLPQSIIPTQKPQPIRESYILLWILGRDDISRTLIFCQKQNTIVLP